ncbi:MAG TPA: Crp/Fnr family transcriptional regulator [Actinomycetota bacterium]
MVPVVERRVGVLEPLPLAIVRPGGVLVGQGEPCRGSWEVEAGVFRVSVVDADGRALLLDLAGPGDALGGPPGSVSQVTVRAVTPARLRATSPGRELERLPRLALDLAWRSLPERVERRLADLAERFGRPVSGGVSIGVRLTQDDLASMVGASREATNRAVRRLVRDGALEMPGRCRYVVRSPVRLAASS